MGKCTLTARSRNWVRGCRRGGRSCLSSRTTCLHVHAGSWCTTFCLHDTHSRHSSSFSDNQNATSSMSRTTCKMVSLGYNSSRNLQNMLMSRYQRKVKHPMERPTVVVHSQNIPASRLPMSPAGMTKVYDVKYRQCTDARHI